MSTDPILLLAWNLRQIRCREEYYAHPTVNGGENRYYANCPHCDHAKETR